MSIEQNNEPNKDFTVLQLEMGKVRVEKFLGEGSVGGVWQIKDEFGYPKALKVLYKVSFADLGKLLSKLKILQKIKHPQIVAMEKLGSMSSSEFQKIAPEGADCPDAKIAFFTMPLAKMNLADYIVMQPENIDQRVSLATQLCLGMRRIHLFQVYNREGELETMSHGHLQFSNLLIYPRGKGFALRIADLGVDLLLGDDEKQEKEFRQQYTQDLPAIHKVLSEVIAFNFPGDPPPFFQELKTLPNLATPKDVQTWIKVLGNFQRKMIDYRRARTLIGLGINLCENGMFDYAIKDFQRVIEMEPTMYQAYFHMGNALKELGKYEEALTNYNKALELSPEEPRVYESRGELYGEQEQYPQAISDFQKALTLDKEAASCHGSLGMIYMQQEDYENALGQFNNLIDLIDDFAPAYIDRGDTRMALKQYSQALEDYKKAEELGADNENSNLQEKISQAETAKQQND